MQFNLLTVDLEEWYVVEALVDRLEVDEWPRLQSTVDRNTRRLLDLFARKRVQATFFLLGWVAERHPELMRLIADHGHEIACHSYSHRRVDTMTRESFREDTQRALDAISATTGIRPIGYRAPSWSINETDRWALEVLSEMDFEYDSSVFPIKHDLYGIPQGPRDMVKLELENGRSILEIPASTHRFMGQNMPLGGGGYLRHSPYWHTRRMIRKLNRDGRPAIVYIHPWEIDPNPPEIPGLSSVQKLRMYGSTDTLEMKLDRLLEEFEFTTMVDFVRYARQRPIGFERA